MTVKQMAAKHNVSPQAIYQRLKKHGTNITALMDKETQELTPEGEMIIDNLFDKKNAPFKANTIAYAEEQKKQITELNIEISTLNVKIAALEEEIASLKDDRDYLRSALSKAQDNQTDILKRLTEPAQAPAAGAQRRLSWRERFTGRLDSQGK